MTADDAREVEPSPVRHDCLSVAPVRRVISPARCALDRMTGVVPGRLAACAAWTFQHWQSHLDNKNPLHPIESEGESVSP